MRGKPKEAQRAPQGDPTESTARSDLRSFGALGSVGGPLDMIYRKEEREPKGEEGKGKVGRRDVYAGSNTPLGIGPANFAGDTRG